MQTTAHDAMATPTWRAACCVPNGPTPTTQKNAQDATPRIGTRNRQALDAAVSWSVGAGGGGAGGGVGRARPRPSHAPTAGRLQPRAPGWPPARLARRQAAVPAPGSCARPHLLQPTATCPPRHRRHRPRAEGGARSVGGGSGARAGEVKRARAQEGGAAAYGKRRARARAHVRRAGRRCRWWRARRQRAWHRHRLVPTPPGARVARARLGAQASAPGLTRVLSPPRRLRWRCAAPRWATFQRAP